MKKLVICFLLLILLVGCANVEGEGTIVEGKPITVFGTGGVVRFVDDEAGVVCWQFDQKVGYAGAGGLSCLPISDTLLSK